MTTKAGHIAIVGRPNVGKSTLMNLILGEKVSITSRKPQTTRHQIRGVKTVGDAQAIFVDTPGLHLKEAKAINRHMNRAARSALFDVDLIIFMIEGTYWTPEDDNVVEHLKKTDKPVMLVINKIDKVRDKDLLLPVIDRLQKKLEFTAIVPISAEKVLNIEELETLIFKSLPEGPFLFGSEERTDRNLLFRVGEIVREKIIRHVSQELPYETTVEIERMEETDKIYHVHALIWVERNGQKAILIGKHGEKLKEIGSAARRDLEVLLHKQVNLQIWIKVKEGWSDSESFLNELGLK